MLTLFDVFVADITAAVVVVVCKRIHVILLFVKCCSCAIRLVKQPKKAGTSQVVFLIELLGFPGGKEEEEEEEERERKKEKKEHRAF